MASRSLTCPAASPPPDTLDDAFVAAQEAILLHLEGILADGELLPRTQPIQTHIANEDYRGGVWGFVDVDLSDVPNRAVRP